MKSFSIVSDSDSIPVTVWGSGSWGTALAILLNSNNHQVCLWDRSLEKIKRMKTTKMNKDFLGTTKIPESLFLTSLQKEACEHSLIHILAVPSKALKELLYNIKPFVQKGTSFVSVIKGLEEHSSHTMSQVIGEVLEKEHCVACLTGPTHAEEVVQQKPCAAVVGSCHTDFSKFIQKHFSTPMFRIYVNNDLIGIELGGALKNVIAIAAGISDGLGFGVNSKSALITRGLSEMKSIIVQEGAKKETVMGLSGIGDLITTCMSSHSRNRYLGECLGKGLTIKEALNSMTMVAEGVHSARSVQALSEKHCLQTPIITNVYDILFNRKSPQKALSQLFERPLKQEVF